MTQQPPRPHLPFRFSLDLHSGVPVYRPIIDQVQGGGWPREL